MTLRDFVRLLDPDEKLMIRRLGEGDMLETSPDELMNEFEDLPNATVSHVWVSYHLYNAIMIELE